MTASSRDSFFRANENSIVAFHVAIVAEPGVVGLMSLENLHAVVEAEDHPLTFGTFAIFRGEIR